MPSLSRCSQFTISTRFRCSGTMTTAKEMTTIMNDARNRSKERSRKHWHLTRAKLSRLCRDWLPVRCFAPKPLSANQLIGLCRQIQLTLTLPILFFLLVHFSIKNISRWISRSQSGLRKMVRRTEPSHNSWRRQWFPACFNETARWVLRVNHRETILVIAII